MSTPFHIGQAVNVFNEKDQTRHNGTITLIDEKETPTRYTVETAFGNVVAHVNDLKKGHIEVVQVTKDDKILSQQEYDSIIARISALEGKPVISGTRQFEQNSPPMEMAQSNASEYTEV